MSELTEEQIRVSMKSKEHLQEWLEKTGRAFLVLRARDLVEALSWPEGTSALQEILFAYREYRRQQPTGMTAQAEVDGELITVPEMKDENPTVDEKRELALRLVGEIRVVDPAWGGQVVPGFAGKNVVDVD